MKYLIHLLLSVMIILSVTFGALKTCIAKDEIKYIKPVDFNDFYCVSNEQLRREAAGTSPDKLTIELSDNFEAQVDEFLWGEELKSISGYEKYYTLEGALNKIEAINPYYENESPVKVMYVSIGFKEENWKEVEKPIPYWIIDIMPGVKFYDVNEWWSNGMFEPYRTYVNILNSEVEFVQLSESDTMPIEELIIIEE